MQVLLIILSAIIWASILIFYWRRDLYVFLDNKLDFERFLSKKSKK